MTAAAFAFLATVLLGLVPRQSLFVAAGSAGGAASPTGRRYARTSFSLPKSDVAVGAVLVAGLMPLVLLVPAALTTVDLTYDRAPDVGIASHAAFSGEMTREAPLERLLDASRVSLAELLAPNTPPRPDFVAGPPGSQPPVPVSQSRMAAGFDAAGFPKTPTTSSGMEYILPDGSRVRLMAPSGQAPLRASFTNPNGGPINPFTGKPVQPPPPSGWSMKDWVRELTHIEQTP